LAGIQGMLPAHPRAAFRAEVDASALNASQLYYLPCRRPDSFFQTYRVDAQPIDPIVWVRAASEEVVEILTYLPSTAAPLKDLTPE
jgi:hypothetical protein